ncbi:MAG: glycosyltransferase family 4 protein [Tannerellaceae bacterium]|nr:glycosyltransferase family 4 protein [Tannerellaceae bacterium]
MNKKETEILFVTNLPSFYKINLYNEINKKRRIFVVFTGDTAGNRNDDFFTGKREFDYIYLSEKSDIKRAFTLWKIINSTTYSELILGGWDSVSMWTAAFASPVRKNALVVESSYLESGSTGIKGYIKKLFMKRISSVYASGKSQRILAENLGFKGRMVITKGVGIFHIVSQPAFISREKIKNFVYVGRLSPEKNLNFLIEVFNKLPELTLNIIGFGPEEDKLRSLSNKNILFWGAVENTKLTSIYQENDVFILPSAVEPWGMVVEEALNNGLPVLVSDKVGCADEIVIPGKNGLVFKSNDQESLRQAVTTIGRLDYYNQLRMNISTMDFAETAKIQVNCYLR